MSHSERQISGKEYWRSLEARAGAPALRELAQREFPEGASELVAGPVSRRKFLGVMGASMALAGVSLPGCIRKPVEHILPYASRPEDVIPGKPIYFATNAFIGGSVLGLLVESQDGRPTKVEGNPSHPMNGGMDRAAIKGDPLFGMSHGATNAWAQASVLTLYDPDRSKTPTKGGAETTWQTLRDFLSDHMAELRRTGGEGLALLLEPVPSPTVRRLLAEVKSAYPKASIHAYAPVSPRNGASGAALVGASGRRPLYALDQADVVLALDSDFLCTEGDAVRNARLFASRRRVTSEAGDMNRLYAVEPTFTPTGAMADNRLRMKAALVGDFLMTLAKELFAHGLPVPPGADAVVAGLRPRGGDERFQKWAGAVAKDLAAHRGRALVVVGERQPPHVHALGALVNAAIGATGVTVSYPEDASELGASGIEQLAAAIAADQVSTLIMLGGNPAYDAPVELGFEALLKRVPTSVHLSLYRDETSKAATWHVPQSHYLEAWGDLAASDGTTGVQQPLIAPLYDTPSEIELLARLVDPTAPTEPRGYELVRATWAASPHGAGDFESSWRRFIHDGVIANGTPSKAPVLRWDGLAKALSEYVPLGTDGIELDFVVDASVYDGRFANNGWLQELPDPMTKITWDNAAFMSPKLAKKLDVTFDTSAGGNQPRPMVQLTVEGRTLDLGVFVIPGIADDTIVLPLGYGRKGVGRVAEGTGFNAYALRTAASPYIAPAATAKKIDGGYKLASTQDHWSMEGRRIVVESTLDAYKSDPELVEKGELMPPEKLKALWPDPHDRSGQQWGMSIDLNVCTGCSACTVACQAENNIPVVGKDQVLRGREMHWIRLDRYYTGSEEDPQAVVQPLQCQHCENAPCESVCPVAATAHSPEGLNDMAYNRCIGTRYCANNCPYKVRRFNFYNFNLDIDPVERMQKNPDVTVRFRGVMEKCTFCVQRIQEAKIAAKRDGDGVVKDGTIVPACAQSCPTNAIVFGDTSDPNSAVSKAKKQNRNYGVLTELFTQPRNTYLAKLRNPNPELV